VPELTVATLNLFNNEHGRWNDRAPLVHAQARALDADVLLFQEVAAGSDQVDGIVDALGDGYVAVPLDNPDPESIKSLAVVTRLAVEAHDACTDLGAGDIALRVRLAPAEGPEVDVVTTHLHFGPSRRGSEIRAAQTRRLLAWLGPVGDRPAIVGGDFNATPAGDTIKGIKRVLRSAHEEANGDEPEWTHPTPFVHAIDAQAAFGVPVLPDGKGHAIDYVFVSPPVDVVSCRTAFDQPAPDEPSLYPSDHIGLVARVAVA
jgi:endonuclease/exonuclease/phosphatase family metal-dependent hydrolase